MRTLIAATAGLLCLAATAAQAGKQDFTLVNNTGYQIDKVFVSSVGSNSWEEDILGKQTLGDGQQVPISFEKGTRGCQYDLKVTYNDNSEVAWHNINLCELSVIHLHWDKEAGNTTATAE